MTTHTRDIRPALGHLEAALEASCASILALDSIRDEALDARSIYAQITRGVEALRAAINELRAVHDTEISMLAFGFVLAAPPGWQRNEAAGRQVKPRRTA